jgi:hypothetical protein
MKIRTSLRIACAALALSFPLTKLHAQERDDDGDDSNEPPAQLEIGPEVEVPFVGEHPGFGGSITLQVTPIPNWLEFEFGVGALASSGATELEVEFMFEKPFQISSTTEFMIEAGPALSHSSEADEGGTLLNIQTEAGFFIWPNRNLGWYASVGWSDAPKNGTQSISVDAGILVPVF